MIKKLFLKHGALFFLALVVIISFFSIKPFFVDGFFSVHDDTQVQRVYEMGQALKDGMFPVRWVKDLGYGFGYPIFNFYSPLPYYFAGIFVLLGANALLATKIMFIVGITLSGVFMYLFAKELLGRVGGLIASVFYLYAPYHAVNIYIRGDVGEVWSYAFMPLLFYSLYKINKTNKLFFAGLLGISYALIILSHNLSAFMITPFVGIAVLLIFYSSIKKKNYFAVKLSMFGLVLGLLISAFYFIPALSELKYTNVNSIIGGGSDFRDHFVCATQLWDSSWGFGGSNPGCLDGISFKLGKIQIVLTIISFVLFVFSYKKIKEEEKNKFATLGLGLLISLFLVLAVSRPIWELAQPMKYIQFPWRFLSFINFFSAILVGYSIVFVNNIYPKKKNIIHFVYLVIVISLFFINSKLFVPQKYLNFPSNYFTNLSNINWTTSRISDEYMPPNFVIPKNQNEIPKTILQETNLKFIDVVNSTKTKEVVAYFPKEKVYVLNIAYYPSWKASINYSQAQIYNIKGRVGIKIPKGYQLIRLEFVSTEIQRSSNLFSVIGLVALFTVIILGIKKKNEKIT